MEVPGKYATPLVGLRLTRRVYSFSFIGSKIRARLTVRSNDNIIVPAKRKGHNSIINERKPRRRALGSLRLPSQLLFFP
jgi:hypothetical protein